VGHEEGGEAEGWIVVTVVTSTVAATSTEASITNPVETGCDEDAVGAAEDSGAVTPEEGRATAKM